MRVYNFHCRRIAAPIDVVGPVIDTLGSDEDRLWPWEHFEPMQLDFRLGIGANGGHGPVRYTTVEYIPGRLAVFEFKAKRGILKNFKGRHWFEAISIDAETTELRHMLYADIRGLMWWAWWIVVETLHDATVEAALAKAELSTTGKLRSPFALTRRQKFWKSISGERGVYDKLGKQAPWSI